MDQTTTTPLIDVVDGAVVTSENKPEQPEQEVTTSTTTVADPDLLDLVQRINDQQQDYGQMLVICFGLIIGILLVSLTRWWR